MKGDTLRAASLSSMPTVNPSAEDRLATDSREAEEKARQAGKVTKEHKRLRTGRLESATASKDGKDTPTASSAPAPPASKVKSQDDDATTTTPGYTPPSFGDSVSPCPVHPRALPPASCTYPSATTTLAYMCSSAPRCAPCNPLAPSTPAAGTPPMCPNPRRRTAATPNGPVPLRPRRRGPSLSGCAPPSWTGP